MLEEHRGEPAGWATLKAKFEGVVEGVEGSLELVYCTGQ